MAKGLFQGYLPVWPKPARSSHEAEGETISDIGMSPLLRRLLILSRQSSEQDHLENCDFSGIMAHAHQTAESSS
jgi:hypothetical protein